jgi:hypothetical protein
LAAATTAAAAAALVAISLAAAAAFALALAWAQSDTIQSDIDKGCRYGISIWDIDMGYESS